MEVKFKVEKSVSRNSMTAEAAEVGVVKETNAIIAADSKFAAPIQPIHGRSREG